MIRKFRALIDGPGWKSGDVFVYDPVIGVRTGKESRGVKPRLLTNSIWADPKTNRYHCHSRRSLRARQAVERRIRKSLRALSVMPAWFELNAEESKPLPEKEWVQ